MATGKDRRWQHLTLSVMHFNTLCEIYEHTHLPTSAMSFKAARCHKISHEISYNSCDVVSLNEVQPISYYRQNFEKYYDILSVSKSDHRRVKVTPAVDSSTPEQITGQLTLDEMRRNNNDTDDMSALMFKRGRVEVLDAIHIPVKAAPSSTSGAPPSVDRQHAILAFCFHVASGRSFLTATMHMKANPMNGSEDPRRIFHAAQVLQRVARYRQEYPAAANAPFVFSGDFNAPPESATMQYMLGGRAQVPSMNQTFHQTWFNFESTQATAGAVQAGFGTNSNVAKEPPLTILDSSHDPQASEGWTCVLDYILIEKGKMLLTSFVTLPTKKELGLKDAVHSTGSDHIPIVAALAFLPPSSSTA